MLFLRVQMVFSSRFISPGVCSRDRAEDSAFALDRNWGTNEKVPLFTLAAFSAKVISLLVSAITAMASESTSGKDKPSATPSPMPRSGFAKEQPRPDCVVSAIGSQGEQRPLAEAQNSSPFGSAPQIGGLERGQGCGQQLDRPPPRRMAMRNFRAVVLLLGRRPDATRWSADVSRERSDEAWRLRACDQCSACFGLPQGGEDGRQQPCHFMSFGTSPSPPPRSWWRAVWGWKT